jgi:hypothetical protein
MCHPLLENSSQVSLIERIRKSKHSRRIVPTRRSQKALAWGAWKGVFKMFRPIPFSAESNFEEQSPAVCKDLNSQAIGSPCKSNSASLCKAVGIEEIGRGWKRGAACPGRGGEIPPPCNLQTARRRHPTVRHRPAAVFWGLERYVCSYWRGQLLLNPCPQRGPALTQPA